MSTRTNEEALKQVIQHIYEQTVVVGNDNVILYDGCGVTRLTLLSVKDALEMSSIPFVLHDLTKGIQ